MENEKTRTPVIMLPPLSDWGRASMRILVDQAKGNVKIVNWQGALAGMAPSDCSATETVNLTRHLICFGGGAARKRWFILARG